MESISKELANHEIRLLALERKAPGGSGPATGSAGRGAGGEPGEWPECREGTDRNRESRAVPPGEAEFGHLANHFAKKVRARAEYYEALRNDAVASDGVMTLEDHLQALAEIHRHLAVCWEGWFRTEPDSDAGIDLTALYDLPAPSVPPGREAPSDERSGRRNGSSEERGAP